MVTEKCTVQLIDHNWMR